MVLLNWRFWKQNRPFVEPSCGLFILLLTAGNSLEVINAERQLQCHDYETEIHLNPLFPRRRRRIGHVRHFQPGTERGGFRQSDLCGSGRRRL
jgi:hypothetical protein